MRPQFEERLEIRRALKVIRPVEPIHIEIDRGHVELSIPKGQRLTVRTDISRRGRLKADFPISWMSAEPHQ
jgi:hypothetical protein